MCEYSPWELSAAPVHARACHATLLYSLATAPGPLTAHGPCVLRPAAIAHQLSRECSSDQQSIQEQLFGQQRRHTPARPGAAAVTALPMAELGSLISSVQ